MKLLLENLVAGKHYTILQNNGAKWVVLLASTSGNDLLYKLCASDKDRTIYRSEYGSVWGDYTIVNEMRESTLEEIAWLDKAAKYNDNSGFPNTQYINTMKLQDRKEGVWYHLITNDENKYEYLSLGRGKSIGLKNNYKFFSTGSFTETLDWIIREATAYEIEYAQKCLAQNKVLDFNPPKEPSINNLYSIY